jgi:hypothetical protein
LSDDPTQHLSVALSYMQHVQTDNVSRAYGQLLGVQDSLGAGAAGQEDLFGKLSPKLCAQARLERSASATVARDGLFRKLSP